MADKQTPASRRLDGQKSTTEAVLAAADEVVAAAKAANSSLPRKSRQRDSQADQGSRCRARHGG